MVIDSKGRLFGRISIVDILIVVIIAAAAIGVYYKYTKTNTSQIFVKNDKVQMTMYIESTQDFVANSIKVGDIVKDRQQGSVLGKVTDVKVDPDIQFNPDSSGKEVVSSRPGYNSVIVTMEGEGVLSSTGGLNIKGMDYYIGKSVETVFNNADVFTRISSITKLGE